MKCIIPAAGFGTRVGMKPNQSKEMLSDPGYKRQPMIQYALDLCKAFKLEPLVITREEKQDLRQYLFNNGVEFIDVKVEGEWYNTVMKSQEHWEENNILLLPDTRFASFKCIQDIKNGLELGNNAVFAMHKVNDPKNWGVILEYNLFEKPERMEDDPTWAWGLIGFKSHYGQELFSNVNHLKLKNVGFTFLNEFKDITRGSK